MFCSLAYALYAVLNREKLLVPMLVDGRGPRRYVRNNKKIRGRECTPPPPLDIGLFLFFVFSSSYQSNVNLSAKDEC